MRVARAILVILTAFSVALLPVAGAVARMDSPQSVSAHTADTPGVPEAHEACCQSGQHCEKHGKGDCAKEAACSFKCSSVSAAPLASSGATLTPYSSPRLALIPAIAISLAPNPPSPPPRL